MLHRLTRGPAILLATVIVFAIHSASAGAASLTLQDGNSTVVADSTLGLTSWTVDGVNQLANQDLYYSIGSAAPQSIESLTNTFTFNQNGILSNTWSGAGFTISTLSTLTGGSTNSGNSSLSQTVTVNNTGEGALALHLYSYTDFNLDGSGVSDTLKLSGGPINTADQTDAHGTDANVSVTRAPDHYQIGTGTTIKLALNGSSAVTLADGSTGPLVGDDNFAFEWDQNVNADGSFQLSVNRVITGGTIANNSNAVPLPPAVWGGAAMLALLAGIRLVQKTAKSIA